MTILYNAKIGEESEEIVRVDFCLSTTQASLSRSG